MTNQTNKEGAEKRLGKEWLKRESAPFRASIVLLAIFALLTTALSVVFAYLVRFLINGATEGDQAKLILFSILLISLLLARILFTVLKNYLTEQYNAKMTAKLRGRLFSRILHADYSAVEKYHSGDLLNRMTTDVAEVSADTVALVPAVVGMVTQLIGATTALLLLDPLFTVIFLGGALVAGGIAVLCRRKLKKVQKEISAADGESRSFIQESASSVMTVKAYSAEARTEEKSTQLLDRYFRKRTERNRLRTGINGTFTLLGGLGTVFALVWCGVGILQGRGDYGSLFSVMMLLGQLERPVAALSSILPLFYAREAASERLAELDALPMEKGESAQNTADVVAIEAEGVTFAYQTGEKGVLRGANVRISARDCVCITGESGSGKSTLFKLLLNVYQPTEGGFYKVLSSGERLPLTAGDRNLFAYVPQGNFLFSGTIRENLSFYSDSAPTDEQIKDALECACAQFVFQLPKGVDSKLRERGGGLSEGQIQRLAVARALLSGRRILLLDEATSALDGQTEQRLLENLAAAQRTCVIVTHRPAALERADVILNVKEGKITATTQKKEQA